MGPFDLRVVNFKIATNAPAFKKGFFDVELGQKTDTGFEPVLVIREFALMESNAGDLYVTGPSRPMISRKDGELSILKDDAGKDRYAQLATFPRSGEGKEARFTAAAMDMKNLLNDLARSAYGSLLSERSGVGTRRPENAPRATTGEELGAPGLSDDDELPF